MKKSLLLSLLLLTFLYSFGQDPTGSIKGSIIAQDKSPLEGVTIKIKKINNEGVSEKNGEFIINDVPVGDYVLIIKLLGHATQQVTAKVETGKTTVIEAIQLKTDWKTLAEIQINGNNNKFLDKKTDYVARLPLTDLENPQVYHSVTKEILQEQMVVNYQEALRNAPGVTTAVYPAGGFAANLRGFLTGVNHRNGMASLTNTKSLDPVNIERLEVIKGPSATLFGSSSISFGGLINEVTKRPFAKSQTEVSYSTGTQGLNRLTADVNTPINKDQTALLRINTAFHQEKSFQTYGHKTSFVLAPTFAYRVNDKLSFVIDAELFFADRTQTIFPTFSAGTTFKNLKDQPIDYKMSLGGDDMDSRAFSNQIIVEAKYKLSPQITSVSNLSYIANQDRSNQVYVTWQNDDSVIRRISNSGPRTNTNLKLQQNFIIDTKIGQMRNRLVAGLDVYKVSSRQNNYAQFAYDTVSVSKPFVAVTANKINAFLGKLNPTFNESFQDTYSAYFSNVIDLTTRLNAMISLRLDRYENKPSRANGIPAATGSFKQTAFSPKFGLVYQLIKEKLSLFGNYMNGFSNVAPFSQPDGNISIFKPLQANQYEFGVKTNAFDNRLNLTASYYNIDLTNATRRTDDGFTVQDGTQKSKGFEIEVIANLVKGLNLSAGYAYNDSYYTKAVVTLQGKKVQATPRDIVNVWASYKFSDDLLKNIGIGVGGNYVSNAYFNTANTFIIPHYTVVNATLFYDQPKWRFGLKANNISDTKYWDRYATAQVTRQWIANVTFKF